MNHKPGISNVSEAHTLSLDLSIYSLEAIKKTAYKFADRASVIISPGPDSTVSLSFSFVGQNAGNDPKQIISDFCNELLDQDLREIVKKDTGVLRNLIIAHAFSRTKLTEED
jgi:His-Xaa-Ser system protein HxsD